MVHNHPECSNETNKFEKELQALFIKLFPSIILDNKKLIIYSKIKTLFRFEPYLKLIINVNSRIAMYRFRASCHNFPIGSEEHMLFRCLHP